MTPDSIEYNSEYGLVFKCDGCGNWHGQHWREYPLEKLTVLCEGCKENSECSHQLINRCKRNNCTDDLGCQDHLMENHDCLEGHNCHEDGCVCSNCCDQEEVRCESCAESWFTKQCVVCEQKKNGGELEKGDETFIHVNCMTKYLELRAEEERNAAA